MKSKKNMKLEAGLVLYFYILFFLSFAEAEDKITTAPLINIEKIKPSFEELDEESEKFY